MLTDTLVLGLNQVTYDSPNLKTIPPGVDMQTGEMGVSADIGGHRVSKAFLNADTFQFDAKAKAGFNGAPMMIESVKFSVPKVLGMDVAGVSLGVADVRTALEIIRDELRENGISVNPFDARLWRVDSTVDILTAHPFQAYASVFECFQYRNSSHVDFGTTYRVGNESVVFCIYDKITELQNHGVDTSEMPESVMRFEFRTKKARALRRLGMSTVNDLLTNYDAQMARTRQAWQKALFRIEDTTGTKSPENVLELLEMAQNGSVRWVSKAEQLMGKKYMLENGIKPGAYYRYLLESGVSRQTASKYRDELIEMELFESNALPLYEELFGKVIDAFGGVSDG
jgi:hypothetical protein